MRIVVVAALAAMLTIGCSGGAEAPAAAAGSTEASEIKGGASKAQGMSSADLTVPSGSENANAPGSKL